MILKISDPNFANKWHENRKILDSTTPVEPTMTDAPQRSYTRFTFALNHSTMHICSDKKWRLSQTNGDT